MNILEQIKQFLSKNGVESTPYWQGSKLIDVIVQVEVSEALKAEVRKIVPSEIELIFEKL